MAKFVVLRDAKDQEFLVNADLIRTATFRTSDYVNIEFDDSHLVVVKDTLAGVLRKLNAD